MTFRRRSNLPNVLPVNVVALCSPSGVVTIQPMVEPIALLIACRPIEAPLLITLRALAQTRPNHAAGADEGKSGTPRDRPELAPDNPVYRALRNSASDRGAGSPRTRFPHLGGRSISVHLPSFTLTPASICANHPPLARMWGDCYPVTSLRRLPAVLVIDSLVGRVATAPPLAARNSRRLFS